MEKSQRIRLEPITTEHTGLIVKWRNNERVYNNFIFSEKFTEEMHNNWLKNYVATGDVVQFVIYDVKEDKPIGSVYFRDIDYIAKKAEYGIFIGEDDYVGRGYGSETAVLALQYAFEAMKLKEVFLRVFADNLGAVKSYENAGFTIDRVEKNAISKNGKTHDLIFMKCINQDN